MKRVLFLIILSLLIPVSIQTQELSVYLSGGFSGINSNYTRGTTETNLGGNLGVNYSFGLSNSFSFMLGLELGFSGNKVALDSYEFIDNLVDDRGTAFIYNVQVQNYLEESNFQSIHIPLILQFKPDLLFPIYFNVGGKIIIPSKQTVNNSAEQLQMTGFYPNFNLLIDDLPQRGFGNVNTLTTQTENDLIPNFALSVQIGTIINLDSNNLYLGLYTDYGVTDVRKNRVTTEQAIINYNPQGINQVQLNNSFNSFQSDASRFLSYGIQLRYSFEKQRRRRYRGNSGCF